MILFTMFTDEIYHTCAIDFMEKIWHRWKWESHDHMDEIVNMQEKVQ